MIYNEGNMHLPFVWCVDTLLLGHIPVINMFSQYLAQGQNCYDQNRNVPCTKD